MMKTMLGERKKKEVYIEFLRIIAIILVIFNHTDGFFLYYSNTDNPLTWWFSFIGSVLCRCNVPLFIMITGTLLLDKEESIRNLYKKRMGRIGIVLILFSLFYYCLNIYRNKVSTFSLTAFLEGVMSGSIQESFWYLYLYLGLLAVLPLLRRMAVASKDDELKYILLLQIILETGIRVLSFLAGVEINGNLYVLNRYVFYLLAGYYLGRRIDTDRASGLYATGAAAIILSLVGTCIIVRIGWHRDGMYSQELLDLFTPVLTLGIFWEIRWFCLRYRISERLERGICEIGDCVFGIYLLEQLARIQLLPLYLYLTENTFGVLACSCYVICSFCLAWLYTELLKRIPLLSRLLI